MKPETQISLYYALILWILFSIAAFIIGAYVEYKSHKKNARYDSYTGQLLPSGKREQYAVADVEAHQYRELDQRISSAHWNLTLLANHLGLYFKYHEATQAPAYITVEKKEEPKVVPVEVPHAQAP